MTERPTERLVLIVDDSPEDRGAVRRHLAKDPESAYRFRESPSGAAGLEASRGETPDCMLLDFDMPDLDGLEVLDEVTGGTGVAPFAVVMLTGRGGEAVAVRALKLGAQDYLVKGEYTPELLRRTVADAIAKVATGRELEAQRRELERLYAEARESDRLKDEFLAMLAHELRNPLAPIQNAVHVLRLRGGDAAMTGRMCDIVERQVRHLARLVDDLLDVARIARGKIALRKESMDLVTAVAQAVEAAGPAIEGRRHALAVSLPPGPLLIDADPTRMGQVLANLLGNASKYTNPGGSIALSAGQEGGEVVIRVRDSGIGIAPEMLPHIFDMFAQADSSLDRADGGLGIGLTLVHRLIGLHGGSVAATSPGLGRGSEFTVRLPSPSARPAMPPGATRRDGATARALHVLVVDDNAPSAESMALLIELLGNDTRVAGDGREALELASAYRPDVILLDIGLPGIDGYEVARRVRARAELEGVLLVAITGYGGEEDRRRSHEAGFDHHVVKPIDIETLSRLLSGRAAGEVTMLGPRPR